MSFYRLWTAMESYFKLTGHGFRATKDFSLDMGSRCILRDGKKIAWFNHYLMGALGSPFENPLGNPLVHDYLICLCSDRPFVTGDASITCYGWKDEA
jgi:hypothetical protein